MQPKTMGDLLAELVDECRDGVGTDRRVIADDLERASNASGLGAAAASLATGAITAPSGGLFEPSILDAALCPIDAPAEQLAAAMAVAGGTNLVFDAPIASGPETAAVNAAAHLIGSTRTVLVTATRNDILERIESQLKELGLAEFAQRLDHRSSAAEVARETNRVLARSWRPQTELGGNRATELEQARRALDEHAHALHQPTHLDLSAFQLINRLQALGQVPLLAVDPVANGDQFRQCAEALAVWAETARKVFPLADHPWRHSTLASWNEDNAMVVRTAVLELTAAQDVAEAGWAELDGLLPGLSVRRVDDLATVEHLCRVAARSPRPGAELVLTVGDEWREQGPLVRDRGRTLSVAQVRIADREVPPPTDVVQWLAMARRQRALSASLAERWTAGLDGLDLAAIAEQMATWLARSPMMRLLPLRRLRAQLRPVAIAQVLADDAEVADDLVMAIEERHLRVALEKCRVLAGRWLGALDRAEPNLEAVAASFAWARELRTAFEAAPIQGAAREAAWRALGAATSAEASELPVFERVAQVTSRLSAALTRFAGLTGIDPQALGRELFAVVRALRADWVDTAALADWVAVNRARQRVLQLGLSKVVSACDAGLPIEVAPVAWEHALVSSVLAQRLAAAPALRHFDGAALHELRSRFGHADREDQRNTKNRISARRSAAMTRAEAHPEERAALTDVNQLGVVDLLVRAPSLFQSAKPCLLATPGAVARCLPARMRFDVVIAVDGDAMSLADAMPALIRAQRGLVIGDRRLCRDGDRSLMSAALGTWPVLSLETCVEPRAPELHRLISHRYFGDALAMPPAPRLDAGHPPLWRSVAATAQGGVVPPGRSAVVDAVVVDVFARLERGPARVAVIAESEGLRAQIAAGLDDAAKERPLRSDVIALYHAGDFAALRGAAADVVLVALDGEEAGELTRGAERAACYAALSLARDHLSVVAPFDREQAAEASPLAAAWADLLQVAAEATPSAAPPTAIAGTIGELLVERGFTVGYRVGDAAWHVDVAIVDPDDPGRYVLGIVLDGRLALPRTARDRDRRDGELLERRGWNLLQVWTLDFWRDPVRETERIAKAVVSAIARARAQRKQPGERAARGTPAPWRGTSSAPMAVAREASAPRAAAGDSSAPTAGREASAPRAASDATAVRVASGSGPAKPAQMSLGQAAEGGVAAWAHPMVPRVTTYAVASVPAGRRTPEDLFESKYAEEAKKLIDAVLAVEAPIHLELLARRVGAYFGIGKVSDNLCGRVRALSEGRAVWGPGPDADVAWRVDQNVELLPQVRTAVGDIRRDVDVVPLSEIAAAAGVVLSRVPGSALADLGRDAARLLGYARLSERVAARMRAGIDLLASRGECVVDGDWASRRRE